MDNLNELLNKASKLGAQGYEVVGYKPPANATDNPTGELIVAYRNFPTSATERPWYLK